MGSGTRGLAGLQDLLLGNGSETQQRTSGPVSITKINASNIPILDETGDSIKDKLDVIKQEDTNNLGIGENVLPNLSAGSNNLALGTNAGASVTNETGNVLIGHNVNTEAGSTDNFLNISNVIKGNILTGDIRLQDEAKLSLNQDEDTYLTENSSSELDIFVNSVNVSNITSIFTNILNHLRLSDEKKLYLNSGETAYIQESPIGTVNLVVDSVNNLNVTDTEIITPGKLIVNDNITAKSQIHLDITGNTYIESNGSDGIEINTNGLKNIDFLSDGRAIAPYVAKAWAHCTYDSGGPSITIDDSYNILSIDIEATGLYKITFENEMDSAIYCVSGFGTRPAPYLDDPMVVGMSYSTPPTINDFFLQTAETGATKVIFDKMNFIVFGG